MASRTATSLLFAPLLRRTTTQTARLLRKPILATPRPAAIPSIVRLAHSIPRPPQKIPAAETPSEEGGEKSAETQAPASKRPYRNNAYYQLTFTCKPCGNRSQHDISKQGYHKGSILITCPSCRNRHVIADHLNIFGDRKVTIEDIMREQGQLVKRGSLGEDGDIEFWPDEKYAEEADKAAAAKEEEK